MDDFLTEFVMTMFDDVSTRAIQVYPNVQIKYKNESVLMKTLGVILFFNPQFMDYITTIGTTIYYPTREFVRDAPISSTIDLLHELVHVRDAQNENKILFGLLYLLPQLLVLLGLPLLFIFGWKIALFSLIFLAPLPAYFRMKDEKKAYTISMYVVNKLNQHGYSINLDVQKQFFVSQFKGSSYYFMWPFKSIDIYFDKVANQLKAGQRPEYEAALFNITDKILGY
jgi:hypothetical protein